MGFDVRYPHILTVEKHMRSYFEVDMRLKNFIGGMGAAVLLLVSSCASLNMVGVNDAPDPEWGYLLLRGRLDEDVTSRLRLGGPSSLWIPLNIEPQGSIRIVRMKPGLYHAKEVSVVKAIGRSYSTGSIDISDRRIFENGIEIRAGELVYIGDWKVAASDEPSEIDEFRSLLLGAFPESPPEEPTTIAEYAVGGYITDGDPVTVRLIIAPLSSFTPEIGTGRGEMYGVVLSTNLLFDKESGRPTRKPMDPDLEVLGSLLPSLYYEKTFVLFENGSLVSSSVYQETEGLDIVSWIPIMLSDGLDAIAAADTLVRDGEPVNDALILRASRLG